MTHPDSKRPQAIQPLCRRGTVSNQDGICTVELQGETSCCPGHRTEAKNFPVVSQQDERMLGNLLDCSFNLINFFPEFQILYLHFLPQFQTPYLPFFFLIKKTGLKRKVKWSVRIHSPPSSLNVSRLNKVPIKIQSLSLFTGLGGNRKH